MKLGIYIPIVETRPGGLGTYTREVTRRMIDRADDVVLFTTTPETVPADWDVEVVGMPADDLSARLGRVVQRFKWLNWDVRAELKRRELDAFFVPTHEGMVGCPIPQTVVVHDLTMLVEPSAYFNPLLVAYMRLVLPLVLQTSAQTVAVSNNTRDDIVRFCGLEPDAVEVVYEGFDTKIFYPRSPDVVAETLERHGLDKPYMLYSGTFAAHKNTPFLAEVLQEIRKTTDVELAFTGRLDVGAFDETRDALQARHMWQHTRSLGYVSYDDLSALMQGAFAFAFPSKYEGFGLAPLEAMASGAAVLSSDRASLPEVMGPDGILLDPTDARAWARAALALLDPVTREQAAGQSIQRASSFSWDDAVDQLFAFIAEDAKR